MYSKVYSATTVGIDAHMVHVQVDLSMGLLQFCIVGLPDKAIKESKDRIRAALKNSGLKLPERMITVNLAPAMLQKRDVLFDVPITIALLHAARTIELSPSFVEETLFLGELSLDGAIAPVSGVLPIAHAAFSWGKKRLIVPLDNVQEASLVKGIEVIGVRTLAQLVAYLRGEQQEPPTMASNDACVLFQEFEYDIDFAQVKGQQSAKRALQIAAAGRHNILFIGPPGSGKTMLAKRLATILPSMEFDQMLQTTKIYSVANHLSPSQRLVARRPFRSPHHTISQAGLVGGGSPPRPGEISLAHNGVLFLDELTEFARGTLEVLREPLENGAVHLSRAHYSVSYPASFMLVAATNPCPCGFYGDTKKQCVCSPQQISKYLAKLSGPLLDRIDLHVHVPAVEYRDLDLAGPQEPSSATLVSGVQSALQLQKKRGQECVNSALVSDQIERICAVSQQARATLELAFTRLGLSVRGYHKILKIARTIADLDGSLTIEQPHVQEAILYRSLERVLHGLPTPAPVPNPQPRAAAMR